MTSKESLRERQQNEFEVIQSIFGTDVEDLRPTEEVWKPLDIKITLTPQRDSGGQSVYARTKLHVVCPPKYPKTAPKIHLDDSKGLSDAQVAQLLKLLENEAEKLKGEVMIYELAQVVQAFLHKHNKPPTGSFYDEMLLQKFQRDQDRLKSQEMKQFQERQAIKEEVLRRKEILRSEARLRRDSRRSISETSPTSSSENSESSSPLYKIHIYPNECVEHRRSDVLYFTNVGRKIQKGSCLGHSQKGCIAFSGIDVETGQLLYITEWTIKYSQLEATCILQCNRPSDMTKCPGHSVDEIIASIEKQVSILSQLCHKNLIRYECVLCIKRKEGIVVYLVQDFLLGTSICSISGSLGWCAEGASLVAKGVLDALIYLHNKGFSHNHLYDSAVFMDNSGTIRVGDFHLVPYLKEIIGDHRPSKGDLPALGKLIESLLPSQHLEMRNFIEKCISEHTITAFDLIQHPFLRPAIEPVRTEDVDRKKDLQKSFDLPEEDPICKSVAVSQSRLRTEFEVLHWLGRGAYGDVLKVRNILDNREYAIKRIPLSTRSRQLKSQLHKKMTREVQLLSRLNHENVVRYYNSWIEISSESEKILCENLKGAGDWSVSYESRKPSNQIPRVVQESDSSSSDWINCIPNNVDSSSDGIEFVNSNGESVEIEDLEEENLESADSRKIVRNNTVQIMYIQMEFCEKSTLRTAIDANLYADVERLWRLFREIAEGLQHIHQQGMIHRDLKPVNIFLDSRDQVKIGDFGLATTSFLALQSQGETNLSVTTTPDIGQSSTGQVGTLLYVAPELTGSASKSTYNQKVDLYSLGIILFEMSCPPFGTGMERVKTIAALRLPEITIPELILADPKLRQQVLVVQWLLSHDPAQRPTSEELLSSDLVPPARLEANELQEMLRHALANPQSRSYKHLVARCLGQKCDTVLELTYQLDLPANSPSLVYAKNKIINLFQKHGGMELSTPLLDPFSKNSFSNTNCVRLMTHSGSVVVLPHDLRIPFARHVALNATNTIRRYTVDRVFREKKVFNFHPKQLHECAFDIITPTPGNLIVDAELISIAYELTNELPQLKQKNISFRLNHTSLLRAILLFCNVPPEKYNDLFAAMFDFMDNRISKFQLVSLVNALLQPSKQSASTLVELLQTDYPLGGTQNQPSSLRLLRGRSEAALLAKNAVRDLESVAMLAQGMGVSCPMHVYAGLPIGYARAKSGGIVWQMLGDLNKTKRTRSYSLAVGGRYDTMIVDFQKIALNSGLPVPQREISGVGFSFALDKIVYALGPMQEVSFRPVDVVVCVTGSRPPLKDVAQLLRSLWSANIRTGVVEANSFDEAQDMGKDLGAPHFICFGDGGSLRVRTWNSDRFQEHHVARAELIDFIQKTLRPDCINSDSVSVPPITNSIAKNNTSTSFPAVNVVFHTNERLTSNLRRRYENQLKQQMSSALECFGKKERITVIAVELPAPTLNAIIGAIDPREIGSKQTDEDVALVAERFPKYKKYILTIFDEVIDILSDRRNPSIVGLFSIADCCYRILL